MSFIDRINEKIVSRIRARRPAATVHGTSLHIVDPSGREIVLALSDLASAAAYQRDVYAGTAVTVRLGFTDGFAIEIGEDDGAWPALLAALDATGRSHVPSATWRLAVIAGGPDGPPIVIV